MSPRTWLTVPLLALLPACPHVDRADARVMDSGSLTGDVADADDARDGPRDAGLDQGCVLEGEGPHCDETAGCCAPLRCDTAVGRGWCTAPCVNSPMAAVERAQCLGPGGTCLTRSDPDPLRPDAATGQCTHACSPSAATSGCLAGFVCTGWWFAHAGDQPDTPGCQPFCSDDSDCLPGHRCHPRTGQCGAGVDLSRRADGLPCAPGSTTECRGLCFAVDALGHGLCGSLVHTRQTSACPDDPGRVRLEAPADTSLRLRDNLGRCLWRTCRDDCDCPGGGGFACVDVLVDGQHRCAWPDATRGEHGTPCAGDAGADDGGA